MPMDPWVEIYDNEQVQWHLRQQVTNHGAAAVASVSLAVLAWSIAAHGVLPFPALLIGIAVVALSAACWTASRILRLRNRVWCLKMSPNMIMGYDYRRYSATVYWADVARIDVTDDAIGIICCNGVTIEIPSIFPDFAHVSHRVLDLAELHRVPVHVDGRSLTETNILVFLPELASLYDHRSVPGPASA